MKRRRLLLPKPKGEFVCARSNAVFPPEIWNRIKSYLPVRDALRLRLVNTGLSRTLLHPFMMEWPQYTDMYADQLPSLALTLHVENTRCQKCQRITNGVMCHCGAHLCGGCTHHDPNCKCPTNVWYCRKCEKGPFVLRDCGPIEARPSSTCSTCTRDSLCRNCMNNDGTCLFCQRLPRFTLCVCGGVMERGRVACKTCLALC